MLTASLILAAVAAGATAVIYGTDAFCALVWRPSLTRLDDTALARSAGAVHRYGDARLPPIGATSIATATASAVTAALAGHPAGTALAGAAVVARGWRSTYASRHRSTARSSVQQPTLSRRSTRGRFSDAGTASSACASRCRQWHSPCCSRRSSRTSKPRKHWLVGLAVPAAGPVR